MNNFPLYHSRATQFQRLTSIFMMPLPASGRLAKQADLTTDESKAIDYLLVLCTSASH